MLLPSTNDPEPSYIRGCWGGKVLINLRGCTMFPGLEESPLHVARYPLLLGGRDEVLHSPQHMAGLGAVPPLRARCLEHPSSQGFGLGSPNCSSDQSCLLGASSARLLGPLHFLLPRASSARRCLPGEPMGAVGEMCSLEGAKCCWLFPSGCFPGGLFPALGTRCSVTATCPSVPILQVSG